MKSFKKFEFDNFIIGEKKKPVEEAVVEVENAEEPPADIIDIEPEPVMENIARTYTEEELQAARDIAEQTGYEKGYKAKSEETEEGVCGLLENINIKLMDIITRREEIEKALEQDFLKLNQEVVRKLIPTLDEEQAVGILNKFLADNFPNIKKSAKLSFYFNPKIIKEVQDQIARLAHINDFEGKISMHKDESLGISDCRIEWDNGGVERNSQELLKKIDNMFGNEPLTREE